MHALIVEVAKGRQTQAKGRFLNLDLGPWKLAQDLGHGHVRGARFAAELLAVTVFGILVLQEAMKE